MARIAWFIPRLIEGSGGHRTMFQNIQALIERGHACTAYLEPDEPGRPIGPREHAAATQRAVGLFGSTGATIRSGFQLDDEFDLIFATAWYTARIVHDLPVTCRKAYFVQDFEAWFNPMGDGYLMAENSYRLGLTPFTIGRWLAQKMHTEFGAVSNYFDFCADRSVYAPDSSIPSQEAVCFVCQPEKPRRCTRIGLEALGILKTYVPDVKIYLFGSAERAPVWFDCEQLGLLSVHQCSALYNRCRAGLCISSSNPSRVPFEMMAAGLPVVDLHRENNLYDLPEEGVLLAEPTPESIAKALATILLDDARQTQMSSAATQFMSDRDLGAGFRQFVAAVEVLLSGRPMTQPLTPRLYTQSGVHARAAWDLTELCGEPATAGAMTSSPFDHSAAQAELASIENSKAWKLIQWIKRTWLYRFIANRRFGPGWDRIDASQPAWERLVRLKASRAYRLIHALKSGRIYRWRARRKRSRQAEPSVDAEHAIALRSVDLWDTLLRRKCHPDEVKLHTARLLFLRHFDAIRPEYRSSEELLRQRMQCEADLGFRERARGNDDEYRIEDVLVVWLQRVLQSRVETVRVRELAAGLLDAELKQEIRVSYPDDLIASRLGRTNGEPLVLISDFYMSPEQLGSIVDHHCPGLKFEGVFTSSAARLNKRSGRLFEEVQRKFGVQPAAHQHLGDNPDCDVDVPRARGMRADLYQNPREQSRREHREHCFQQRKQTISPYLGMLRSRLERECPAPAGSSDERALFELGRDWSPLYCGYALFILEEAIKTRADRVWYFTREGEFFSRLHDALATHSVLDGPVPAAGVLEVSRLATYFPSMRDVTVEELLRVWSLYSSQSMRAMFRTLDLDVSDFQPFLRAAGIPADEPIENPWLDARVKRLFADAGFLDRMRGLREERRRLAFAYLAARGIDPKPEQLFIVDIGWRGTIQDNLAYLLPDTNVLGCYLGLFSYLNPQPKNVTKRAFGPDENLGGPTIAELIKHVAPLEMLANSSAGSVLRYRERDGVVEAQREIDPAENAVFESYTRHFQAGVLAAAPVFADWAACHAISADELRPHAFEILGQLQRNPPAVVARAFFSLSHNETFGVGQYANKRPRFPLRLAASGVLSRRRASQFVRFIEDTGWPQGFLKYYRLRPLCRLYNDYSSARAKRLDAEMGFLKHPP